MGILGTVALSKNRITFLFSDITTETFPLSPLSSKISDLKIKKF